MTSRTNYPGLRHAAMLLVVLTAMLAASNIARAACDELTIINVSNCPLQVCVTLVNGVTNCITVPAGTNVRISVVPGLQSVTIRDKNGNTVPLQLAGCVTSIALAPDCCVRACLVQNGCNYTLTVTEVDPASCRH